MVGVPSIRHESEIRALIEALRGQTDAPPALLLTIATRQSYERLPAILLAAMRHPSFGVLIARSELAIALGDQRLCDAEHEIKGICEAAHCPLSSLVDANSELVWHRADSRPTVASKLACAFDSPRAISHKLASSRPSMLEPIASGH
jgi:hypothetical protein